MDITRSATAPRQSYIYSPATTTATTPKAPSSRPSTERGTSSAFSSSSNPDEDWTKLSDLAERRRVQNRIAQRNYRKKLKRRLEDRERVAGSASPEYGESANKINPEFGDHHATPGLTPSQYSPPTHHHEKTMFGHDFELEGSRTPPLFSYHSYPAPEDIVYPPYPQYGATIAKEEHDYLAPVPVTLPSMMHFNELIKRETEDIMNPFNMSYQGFPAIDIHASYGCGDSNIHTPPLSYSYESEYSTVSTTPLLQSCSQEALLPENGCGSLPLLLSVRADKSTIIPSLPKGPHTFPPMEAPKYSHTLDPARIEREPSTFPNVSGSSTTSLMDPVYSGYHHRVLSIPGQDVKSFSQGFSAKLHTPIGGIEHIKKHTRPCTCSDPSCKELELNHKTSLQQNQEDERGTSDLFSSVNLYILHRIGWPLQGKSNTDMEYAHGENYGLVHTLKEGKVARKSTSMADSTFWQLWQLWQKGDLRQIKGQPQRLNIPRYLGVQHHLIIHGHALSPRLFILSPSAEAVVNYLLRSLNISLPTLNLTVNYSNHPVIAKQLEDVILKDSAEMKSDLEEEVQLADWNSSNTQSESDFSNSGDDTDWEADEEFLPIDERFLFTTPDDLIMSMVRGLSKIMLEPILTESRKELVDRLMAEFWQLGFKEFSANLRHRGSSQTSDSSSVPNYSSQRAEDSSPKKSRRRATEDDWDDNGMDDDGQRRKRPRLEASKAGSIEAASLFACPYRKHNPRKYNIKDSPRCALTGHSTTARVKAHLYRHHRIHLCRRCKVLFSSEEELDVHELAPAGCETRDAPPIEGITSKIKEQLQCRKKSYPSETEAERWHRIYQILFPNAEPLSSPYFEPVIDHHEQDEDSTPQSPDSRKLTRYEEYLRRELPRYFQNVLETAVRGEVQSIERRLRGEIMSLLDEARNHALSNYHTPPNSNQEIRFPASVIGNETTTETTTDMDNGTNGTGILEAMYQPPPPTEHPELSLNFSDFIMEPNCLITNGFSNPSDDSSNKNLPSLSTLSEGSMHDGSESSMTEASSFQDPQNIHNISSKELQLNEEMQFFDRMWEFDPNFWTG